MSDFKILKIPLWNPLRIIIYVKIFTRESKSFQTKIKKNKKKDFCFVFRSFVVKELTPEELEKTEYFAKACTEILKSEKSENEKLSFGIPIDKRNASLPLYQTKKITNQLDFRNEERTKRSQMSDNETKISVSNNVKHFSYLMQRWKRHSLKTRLQSDSNTDVYDEVDSVNETKYVSDEKPERQQIVQTVKPIPLAPRQRAEKPTLFRNVTKRSV